MRGKEGLFLWEYYPAGPPGLKGKAKVQHKALFGRGLLWDERWGSEGRHKIAFKVTTTTASRAIMINKWCGGFTVMGKGRDV